MPDDRTSYHHGNLRRALLEAAERLLVERGAERISLRAISRSAGVSHAAPYHHFAHLDELLAAVAADGFERLRRSMQERAVAASGSPLGALQEAGVGYVLFATRNPELFRLMFGGRLRERRQYAELSRAADAAFAVLGDMLAGAAGSDGGGRSRDHLHRAARAAWATVHGLSVLLIDGRLDMDWHDERAVETLAREVTAVLGPGLRS